MRNLSILFFLPILLLACAKQQELAAPTPNTGDSYLEELKGNLKASNLEYKMEAYSSNPHLTVHTTAEPGEQNIAGVLELNDKVEILNRKPAAGGKLVEARVLESHAGLETGNVVFVPIEYLNTTPAAETSPAGQADGLFVVQNLATEKLRVYRRCHAGEGCANKMILETDIIAGEDESGTRSNVGYYRIQRWEKFYEDGSGLYPSWYKPGYPAVPPPHADKTDWLEQRYMPHGHGSARGAFGWYTAILGPNPHNQWMHGTYGWGADKQDFIHFKNSFWAGIVNIFTSIRSHGCTRVDNEGIAYLRHILPVGTAIVKVYAKETMSDPSLHEYSGAPQSGSWSYIMNTVGANTSSGMSADRGEVLRANISPSSYIEQGTYLFNRIPHTARGDLYGVGDRAFSGVLDVDSGTVVNYQAPASLGRGGFGDQTYPSAMTGATRTH
jgi:hypothetical protein